MMKLLGSSSARLLGAVAVRLTQLMSLFGVFPQTSKQSTCSDAVSQVQGLHSIL